MKMSLYAASALALGSTTNRPAGDQQIYELDGRQQRPVGRWHLHSMYASEQSMLLCKDHLNTDQCLEVRQGSEAVISCLCRLGVKANHMILGFEV